MRSVSLSRLLHKTSQRNCCCHSGRGGIITNTMMQKIYARYRYSLILLRELVRTDFKLRYQGSVLGMMWSVLKPLMLFAIMYIVFVRFLKFGANIPHFAVSLLLAQTLWGFFQETASQGMMAIVGRGDLLRKIKFPKYIVVVSSSVSAFINLAISLVIVALFMLINGVPLRWTMLIFPIVVVELYIFSLGVAFILSSMYVKFRDICHIWDVFMQMWFYVTPIIYPISMIANAGTPAMMTIAKVIMLNPLAQIIQDARYTLIGKTDTVWSLIGSGPWSLLKLIPVLSVIAIFVLGVVIFKRASKTFTEEL